MLILPEYRESFLEFINYFTKSEGKNLDYSRKENYKLIMSHHSGNLISIQMALNFTRIKDLYNQNPMDYISIILFERLESLKSVER